MRISKWGGWREDGGPGKAIVCKGHVVDCFFREVAPVLSPDPHETLEGQGSARSH